MVSGRYSGTSACTNDSQVKQKTRGELFMPNGTGMYFGTPLRHWRAVRRISQFELFLEAHFSTRHLSCVETGRAQPSRETVLRLAEAPQSPLRERNTQLAAASFSLLSEPPRNGGRPMRTTRLVEDLIYS
jgi:predicted transcriptional regulator